MADEFNTTTNWWDSSRNRFDSGSSSSSSGLNSLGSFAWPSEMVDVKGRSSIESASVSDSSVVFHDTQKLQQGQDSGADLHMMGLGLSSQAMDWNQALLRSDKTDSSLRSMLQENLNSSTSYQQETGIGSSQFSPHGSSCDSTVTCQGLQFQMDSTAIYGSPSTMLQGLLGSDNQPTQQSSFENRSMSYTYGANYGITSNELVPSWANKQNISEVRDSSTVVKKSGSEGATKRPRNETPSPMPAFKVRKEKMGDRITALQQLVSPFGKTDTASVLSEAIEYIKFLHEQVTVLSNPYMKSTGAPMHHQQNSDKSSKDPEGQKQDLRSRGLCLVPVSSTFPVTHETTVDFWTPTFGGTFR
ncbi:hypothetical protein GH714_024650 [Hevea brasiliensis]|uniref:BHLH domain-containing protein n=1 Tax=Hevea brasiliensis TaxID=3981 RepID=A0A6A6MKJ2_HEVBR|nr:hypothetical protein GH714_024650 [Hevea brasiliensis]